jgi:post-segregation antitoxin (ccd killing protein)
VKVHKDFKISGQIDSKSGISYTSLIRQIEAGLKKGHSQDNIIDGVIRAVIPSSSLRSYLDGRQDMSLSTLRGILRAHYAEKNSTELYTELASSVQSTKETSSEFLIRSMDLRNKILFASQENSDELKYSPDLVHKLFSRTVQTGLRDQVLRQEMKTILADNTRTDADLLDELNKIVRRENENKQKVGKTVVAAAKYSEPDSSIAELVKEVKALKMDIARLKDTALSEEVSSHARMCDLQGTESQVSSLLVMWCQRAPKTKLQKPSTVQTFVN